MSGTEWPILNQAHQALRATVRGVAPADWNRPTPCAEWNATQVLQHAAGDQLGYAAMITGGPPPAEDPFKPSGVLADSPEAETAAATGASVAAWATVARDAREVSVPVPPGTMSAALGAGACALDAAVHAWDIAVATGRPSPLTPAMARELLEVARQIVEPLRQYGAYAAALPPQDADDDIATLLRYLGRNPNWTP